MLDLIITYINFVILSIKHLVKLVLFHPPNPKTYKIKESPNNSKNHFEIYIKNKNYKYYHKVKKRVQLDIEFEMIPDKQNNKIPLFLFKPTLSIHHACIIYCHGNSCDIGSNLNECSDLAKLTKCIVINFDYPGYGIYENKSPTEKNIYETSQIIFEYVKNKLNFDEQSIIVYGFSLGTGVAFDLACNKDYNFGGLILQSPFLSIFRTLYNTKKTKYFDLFNNCDKAKFLKIKTLFIHGNEDKIVPYIHGRILSKLIPKKYLYSFHTIDGAGHNDIFTSKNLMLLSEIINEFIEQCCNSIKFKDNKTVKIKEINKINFNFDINKNLNNSFINYNTNTNNIFNISTNEKKKKENEIENKSFSESNSAFFSRKKDSFLDLLKSNKNDESHLIKTMSKFWGMDDEKNGSTSVDKFLKKYNKNHKSKDNNIEKMDKKFTSNYNDTKTMNVSESSLNQKEDFSDKAIDFNNIIEKKTSLQQIIDISKSD